MKLLPKKYTHPDPFCNYQHMMWDQANFGDVLLSAVIGRPVMQVGNHMRDAACCISIYCIIANPDWGEMMARKCLYSNFPPLQAAWVFHGKQPEFNSTWAQLHVDLLKGRNEHLLVESTAMQRELSR